MNNEHRISQSAKNARGKDYYKRQIDYYDSRAFGDPHFQFDGRIEFDAMKANYDLMNNIINEADFNHVVKPWGEGGGELPAKFANKDITSPKIKAVLGIESKRPFNYKVVAVNEEATTRKEQEESAKIRQFVIEQIMAPLKEEAMRQTGQQQEQPAEVQTPEEVKRYMRRQHQDPAEILAAQTLAYLSQKLFLKDHFNKGAKHAAISGREVYWVGDVRGEPAIITVNPLYFDHDKSPDLQFIEDGEWAICEYRMLPSQIIGTFDELTNSEIDKINELYKANSSNEAFNANPRWEDTDYIRVLHVTWKGLRKIGTLDYKDMQGQKRQKVVADTYTLNKEAGDISITWEWIPEVHEGYKIGADIYTRMRPLPNQFKDPDNIYECKLPYVGAVYDFENSRPTSLVDRAKHWQYLYDIIAYRMELLLAKDKGRIAAVNINSVPTTQGLDLKKFEYYMEANQLIYLNPNEEGMRNQSDPNITNLLKEINLSNTTDISFYIKFLEYVDVMCGQAMGVTKQLEGQIAEREAVSNVQRSVQFSTNILESFFQTHDQVKLNVLTRLLETAKVLYAIGKPRKLSYFLDDMSVATLTIDQELLDNSTYGIFITDGYKVQENQETMKVLAQAAMQNQMIPLSSVTRVLQAGSVREAEEFLQEGEATMQERATQAAEAERQHQMEMYKLQMQMEEQKHQWELEKLREEERLKKDRELAKQAILAAGFAEDKDLNKNKKLDVLEMADYFLQKRKLDLEEQKIKAQKSSK